MRPSPRRGLLAGLVLGEGAVVGALHRLGSVEGLAVPRGEVGAWLRSAPPEDVAAVLARLVALGCAWWVLGTTCVYVLVRARGPGALAHVVGSATLPAARRLIDRAVATSALATSLALASPAAAAPGPPPEPRSGRAVETVPTAPGPTPDSPAADPVPPAPEPLAPGASCVHVVAPGEHLWSIAEAVATGGVGPYWSRLVEANRGTLRSGNPDLVYPGEVVALPPESPVDAPGV